jgi:hypothetical protein
MPGIVACEALYNLVERFAPDAAVRYVPAGLHEFPVNVPVPDDIHDRVQTAIDELDVPTRKEIVVSYALEGTGGRLSAEHSSLTISPAADCISTVLSAGTNEFGEKKAQGTLYLTRGWIDCGVDSYKLYRTYRDDLEEVLSQFEVAGDRHQDLRVSWHRGDRFQQARDRPAPASGALVDDFFRSIVDHYEQVVLVDTGDLYPFHRQYAEQVQRFIEELHTDSRAEDAVELRVRPGSTAGFRRLLSLEEAGEP